MYIDSKVQWIEWCTLIAVASYHATNHNNYVYVRKHHMRSGWITLRGNLELHSMSNVIYNILLNV